MGMILRIASSRIVGQGDIVGRSGYFSLNLSANSVMRGRLDARRTLKSLVADLRVNSSRWVEKGDYLRLKNITLGYRIPHKILSKIGCSSARIYVSANNLWTITNYSGFDPEASMGADSDAAGVDRGVYPSSKSFLVGLDISF